MDAQGCRGREAENGTVRKRGSVQIETREVLDLPNSILEVTELEDSENALQNHRPASSLHEKLSNLLKP
jgi:hypothetical protein